MTHCMCGMFFSKCIDTDYIRYIYLSIAYIIILNKFTDKIFYYIVRAAAVYVCVHICIIFI